MMSSNGKMFENYFSIHWHYPILQVTNVFFGVSHMVGFIKRSFWATGFWVSPELAKVHLTFAQF